MLEPELWPCNRLRVVSKFGDGDCGTGEIHTRARKLETTRSLAVQEPKRFSIYDISFVIEKIHFCSSPPSSNCEQSQPLLKSVPPSDENQADKTH